MFTDSIVRIAKVKKYISKQISTSLADEPGILNYLDDTVYTLSMVQERLHKINKILKERNKNDNNN